MHDTAVRVPRKEIRGKAPCSASGDEAQLQRVLELVRPGESGWRLQPTVETHLVESVRGGGGGGASRRYGDKQVSVIRGQHRSNAWRRWRRSHRADCSGQRSHPVGHAQSAKRLGVRCPNCSRRNLHGLGGDDVICIRRVGQQEGVSSGCSNLIQLELCVVQQAASSRRSHLLFQRPIPCSLRRVSRNVTIVSLRRY